MQILKDQRIMVRNKVTVVDFERGKGRNIML